MIKRFLASLVLLPPVMLQQHTPPAPPTPVPPSKPRSVNTVLLNYPLEGHSGNMIYLSGAGFRPNTTVNVLMTCPNWDSPIARANHNWFLFPGTKTDEYGEFTAFPIKAIKLSGVDSSPCTLYPRYDDAPFIDQSIPGQYTIIAHNQPLPRSSRIIQANVSVHPKSQHSGLREDIYISHGWGGAVASVTIAYPGAKPNAFTRKLDYEGRLHFHVTVAGAGSQSGVATVSVQFRLGSVRGQTRTTFRVVR